VLLAGAPTALGQSADDPAIAGVGDAFDAAELIPAASGALPPVLPGQEQGARTRVAEPEAPPSDSAREWFGKSPWTDWTRVTGDWDGPRIALEDHGIDVNGSLVSEWSLFPEGSTGGDSAFRFLLDLNASFDLELLAGIEGATVFADFQTADTGVGDVFNGGFVAYSNIAIGGSITQLSQLWWEQWLAGRTVRLKVGKVDANSEFAYLPAAGGFINSSAGFTPTIFAFPTYPNPATAINAFVYPTDSTYVGFGVYDGAATVDGVPTGSRGPATFFSDDESDDWFLIAEAGVEVEEGALAGLRAGVGAWWHTGDFDTFSGGTDDGTGGFYAIAQGRLWSPNAAQGETPEGAAAADDDGLGLWLFGQYGLADDEVSAVRQHIGAGLSLEGTFAGRDGDSCGVYLSVVDFTDAPAAGFDASETALEVFYDFEVTPWFHVKPDLQWYFDPSGSSAAEDSLVATLRCTIVF